MTYRAGDKSKRPPECERDTFKPFTPEFPRNPFTDAPNATGQWGSCPHLKEIGGGFAGERYSRKICGEYFFLDYEEMK